MTVKSVAIQNRHTDFVEGSWGVWCLGFNFLFEAVLLHTDMANFTSTHGGYHFSGNAPKTSLQEITDKWLKTGLLAEAGGSESELAMCMATCLETQRLANEQIEDDSRYAQWKRLNIPVLVRLFRTCEAFKRNAFVNFFEDISMQSMLVFKTRFVVPEPANPHARLDAECEFAETFSKAIGREIETAFRDRRNSEVIFRGLDMLEDKTVIMYYA